MSRCGRDNFRKAARPERGGRSNVIDPHRILPRVREIEISLKAPFGEAPLRGIFDFARIGV